MSVAPRWKRRADEIAEAIGDELSINGTVSIGNDVNLSVATITALADAITSVLNPTSIAAAIWLGQEVGTHVATVVAPVAPEVQRQYSVTLNGVYQATRSHMYTYNMSSQIGANTYAIGTVFDILYAGSTQYRFLNPAGLVHNVNVVSTNTTPVHVQVRNVAGGFTAMGSDISTSMKLSAQPVSVADTVHVDTLVGASVAITGSVNLNVGSSTVPISNPNNITVPVVNTNSVTVPVSLGSVTVPIKATAAGIPQNVSGVSVYVPVDGNHSVTVPVANSNSVTVPVSGGTSSVPISGGTSSVPVANTNNVTVPVTSSGTVLEVKIVEISTTTPSGGVAPITAFHEAMETALEQAEHVVVVDRDADLRGTIHAKSNAYAGQSGHGNAANQTVATGHVWYIMLDSGGQVSGVRVVSADYGGNLFDPGLIGRRVVSRRTSRLDWWQLVDDEPITTLGTVVAKSNNNSGTGYIVMGDNGRSYSDVSVKLNGTQQHTSTTTHNGRRVSQIAVGNYTTWELIDI